MRLTVNGETREAPDQTTLAGLLASAGVDATAFDRAMFALGFDLTAAEAPKADIPSDIADLAKQRWEAKLGKDWAKADALRKDLAARGWSMKDAKDSYTLEPIKP